MIVTGMEDFLIVCRNKLLEWYNSHYFIGYNHRGNTRIDLRDIFVEWSCNTLQNYRALLSTTVPDDGIYAEFTYNGDKQELYMDVYMKILDEKITD